MAGILGGWGGFRVAGVGEKVSCSYSGIPPGKMAIATPANIAVSRLLIHLLGAASHLLSLRCSSFLVLFLLPCPWCWFLFFVVHSSC